MRFYQVYKYFLVNMRPVQDNSISALDRIDTKKCYFKHFILFLHIAIVDCGWSSVNKGSVVTPEIKPKTVPSFDPR